ncbi:MAG: penicillin acylase family protein [Cyclobacteriaceae bacterium]|nr:penicillin acylase family protein [Cyclobacteriaceae bacterium]
MKFLRFLLSFIISAGLILFLNMPVSIPGAGNLPPIGKLLDPFHGFWQNAEKDPLDLKFSLDQPGLTGEVEVLYEKNLIPHIYASSEYDLYFVQGYVTAYHRLWQMEFLSYVASGRVSEILGSMALSFDRRQRRKGLAFGAENSLKELEKEKSHIHFLEAYTDGVNAYIDQLEYRDFPVEYKLLNYRPEKWTLFKNVLLLKYMADDLSGSDNDLQNTNIVNAFGKKRFDFLFPEVPEGIDPVIPEDIKWNFDPVKIKVPEEFSIRNRYSPVVPEDKPEGIGSNSWAVSPGKTKNGNAILCNDPHLQFSMPSIWFAQQLSGPGINAYGVTIPGLPGLLLGFNDSIAWGLTNAPRDIRDWYEITFRAGGTEEYLYDGQWLKTQKRPEIIKIKGDKSFTDTVIYTHYGPVVYDDTFPEDTSMRNFSLRWTAHNPSKELLVIYNLNRIQNMQEVAHVLKDFECPPQNIVVATRHGDIGMFIEGKFPLKWSEQGKFLMDGSDPKYEWQGYIPDEHDARVINPKRGFVSSANQHPFTRKYPYYYYNNTEEYFRNRRINNKLSMLTNITIDEMKLLQNDTYHMLASEALPVMLDSLHTGNLDENQLFIYRDLREWNYYTLPDQISPSYFEVWWSKLNDYLWDEYDGDIPMVKPDDYITVKILNDFPLDSAFDIKHTPERENMNNILLTSYLATVDSILNWKNLHDGEEPLWYKFKNTRLMHLTNLQPFSLFEIPIGGNKHIVSANGPKWGASWRQIVEMGEEIRALGIYPGGQSGNPGSPAYDTFVDQWASGEYFEIKFWKEPDITHADIKSFLFKP